mgnify:FL=1
MPADDQVLSDLRARMEQLISENYSMRSRLKDKEAALSSASKRAELTESQLQNTSTEQGDVALLQKEITTLREENARLTDNLAELRSSQAGSVTQNTEISVRLQKMEAQLAAAYREKQQLVEELETSQQAARLALIESQAGDLSSPQEERLRQKEREIQRLTLMLEAERKEFEMEKAQLEGMLFDPVVTEREQLERLNDLQRQLDLADQALDEQRRMYEGKIDALEAGRDFTPPSMPATEEMETLAARTAPIMQASPSARRPTAPPTPDRSVSRANITPEPAELSGRNAQSAADAPFMSALERGQGNEAARDDDMEITFIPEGEEGNKPPSLPREPLGARSLEEQSAQNQASLNVVRALSGALSAAPLEDNFANIVRSQEDFSVINVTRGIVSWQSGTVRGISASLPLRAKSFDEAVEASLESLERACDGSFEASPEILRKSSNMNIFTYNATCNPGQPGSSASALIFYNDGGRNVRVISYDASSIGTAAPKRDALIEKMMSGALDIAS